MTPALKVRREVSLRGAVGDEAIYYMIQIIPAIDVATEEEYRDTLKKIENSGVFKGGWVHVDVSDGVFTPWKTISPEVVKKHPTKLKIELHLMVENPKEIIDKLESVDLGRIITHIEVEKSAHIAINPETPVSILDGLQAESVLIMAIHPGKQGQEFIPETLEKIKQIRKSHPNILIGVDGGVTPENAKLIIDAGADYLVVGSHLIEGNIDENLEAFWEKIYA